MEEDKIKAKDDIKSNEQHRALIATTKKLKKGKFVKSKKKPNMSKISCFGCNAHGHFKRDCPIKQKNKRKLRIKPHTIEQIGEPQKKLKKEDIKDHYY